MIPFRRLAPLVALFLVLFPTACATAGAGEGDGGVAIRVDNNLIPPASLTVSIVSVDTGFERLLGTITPGSQKSFRFEPVGASGRYRLVGETVSGTEIPSTPFVLTDSEAIVNWDLQSRIATVNDTGEG